MASVTLTSVTLTSVALTSVALTSVARPSAARDQAPRDSHAPTADSTRPDTTPPARESETFAEHASPSSRHDPSHSRGPHCKTECRTSTNFAWPRTSRSDPARDLGQLAPPPTSSCHTRAVSECRPGTRTRAHERPRTRLDPDAHTPAHRPRGCTPTVDKRTATSARGRR